MPTDGVVVAWCVPADTIEDDLTHITLNYFNEPSLGRLEFLLVRYAEANSSFYVHFTGAGELGNAVVSFVDLGRSPHLEQLKRSVDDVSPDLSPFSPWLPHMSWWYDDEGFDKPNLDKLQLVRSVRVTGVGFIMSGDANLSRNFLLQ